MVNIHRLVFTYKRILNILYKENLSVNEIIEQTGKDRTFITHVLRELERFGFIEPIEFQKQHKQKKFKKLSKLGKEIARITFNIENFNKEFFTLLRLNDEFKELDEEIQKFKKAELKYKPYNYIKKTHYEIITNRKKTNSKRILIMKLKDKGWTDTEIEYYDECKEGIYYIILSLNEGLIKILLQKFLFVLDNFTLNDGTREIINRIIIEIFQVQLSNIVTNTRNDYTEYLIKNKKDMNDKINYSRYYPNFKLDPSDYMDNLFFPFSSQVSVTVEKLILFYLNILYPLKEIIKSKIKNMENDIENAPSYEINNGDIAKDELIIRSRCLINAYKKYSISN